MRADGLEQLRKPNEEMQICSFLWVYYGFPVSCYEGRNVEEVRFMSGYKMGKTDESEVDCACGIPDSGVGRKRYSLSSCHCKIYTYLAA